MSAAKEHPLCLGARLSGGGFGGVSIHLVKLDDMENYRQDMQKSLTEKLGFSPDMLLALPSRGAGVIRL